MGSRHHFAIRSLCIGFLVIGLHAFAGAATLVSCPNLGDSGDLTDRGIYVTDYPGTTLGTVTFSYDTDVAGSYTVSLTARSGTYNGTEIGSTQTVTAMVPTSGEVSMMFDFGNAPVTPGSTVTFTQTLVSGPGSLYFDTGPCEDSCSSCPGVFETEGTNPPLDVFRRGSVGITITDVTIPKRPSDNLLVNADFATDLSGWIPFGTAVWSNRDVNGSTSSGSTFATVSPSSGSIDSGVQQCVALPNTGPFDVGGRFFFPSGPGQMGFGRIYLYWYSDSSCSSSLLKGQQFDMSAPVPTDSWTSLTSYKVTPPAGSLGVLVAFAIEGQPPIDGYIDGTFFRPTSCTPADQDLCLNGGRFRVTAEWESTTNGGVGHGVQFNDDSGYFWFFNADNTEVVVKVLNACPNPFNHYWVFGAGLTNVLVTLNVEDTTAGVVNHYINPEGTAFLPLQDTAAFDTCP